MDTQTVTMPPTAPEAGAALTSQIETLIKRDPEIPTVGVQASSDMHDVFESAARRIEAVAQEGLDRANEVMLKATEVANRLRTTGSSLRERIELESSKALHIDLLFEEAGRVIAEHGTKAPPA